MQKITPFLWFNDQAEEAANFYVSVFKDGRIISVMPGQNGKASGVTFELFGQQFIGLNGGPAHTFTPAVSFFVDCKTQEEVDELWQKLSEGGREDRCGWLQDKYGLSWQIIPSILNELLQDKDKEKANKAMQAMLTMKKIDIKALQNAVNA